MLAAAVAVGSVAFADGGYSLGSRTAASVLTWTGLVAGLGFGLFPRSRLPRVALTVGGLFALCAAVTGLSIVWSSNAEASLAELNRALMYVGVFALVAVAAQRSDAGAWAAGLGAAIGTVGVVALASRCLHGLAVTDRIAHLLPGAATRLSYPLGYWNGLAILLALGFPLLAHTALEARAPLVRGAALASLPALAAAVYLTSSRGGVATAIVGLVVLLLLHPRRLALVAALALAGLGATGAIAILVARHTLVDGPLGSSSGRAQGQSAAILIALLVVATGVGWGLLARPALLTARSPKLSRAVVAVILATLVVGAVAAHPAGRFREFRRPLAEFQVPVTDFVRAHLLSGAGTGRWQFWEAAIDEWRSRPLLGRGAASYQVWWYEHGSIAYTLRNAHSLYLETLGDLGLVGGVPLIAAFLLAFGTGLRRLRAPPELAGATAALLAAGVAFAVGAGIDWVWQLTAVGGIGVSCLALLTGPATAVQSSAAVAHTRLWLRLAAAGIGAAVIVVAVVPWMAAREVDRSRAAARSGDLSVAYGLAQGAHALEPFAASPSLQASLVAEDAGDLALARADIAAALHASREDWTLWLVAARLATRSGDLTAARRDFAHLRRLNPRSALIGAAEAP